MGKTKKESKNVVASHRKKGGGSDSLSNAPEKSPQIFERPVTDFRNYHSSDDRYAQLSLRDLLEARDLYHVHLMEHPHVVATAVGYYRIRHEDDWPNRDGIAKKHGTGPRRLDNSEVRSYSWPAVLVFVDEWVRTEKFTAGGHYEPDEIVPRTLYLPDGRRVPVCVIEAPRELEIPAARRLPEFPINNIGGGFPVIANVQGRKHFATIACLVTDGHKAYALTNRHVTGEAGEVIYSRLGGKEQRIGVATSKQLTRMGFPDLYPGWPGQSVFVNLDVGLIDIDDLDQWTAQVRTADGPITTGPLADLCVSNITLSLIGCHVRGYGSASGEMKGEIQALFYRYKSQGGFEYVSDFLIGPRSEPTGAARAKNGRTSTPFATHPGDSGTLWLLEPVAGKAGLAETNGNRRSTSPALPLAVQWGANVFESGETEKPQAYALATCLSTVCNHLGIDLVRDWNLDQADTWGAFGHFSIASSITGALSGAHPNLAALMDKNLKIISHEPETILSSDFKGMGSADFVPLADVPDFFWKHGTQGASRPNEGPNHFADMDQARPSDGKDLLALSANPNNIDPRVWDQFYDSVRDLLKDEPIAQKHRGLLPFRVWQIFDSMCDFVKNRQGAEFVCAAGVLAHYVGDACQPLHISYLHDGDPEQKVIRTVHHRNGNVEDVADPLGKGVHSAYEDEMVNAYREEILQGLTKTLSVAPGEFVTSGADAARKTVDLMRTTFDRIPPRTIVNAFLEYGKKRAGRAEFMWERFGADTIECMKAGTHLLAVLWESAWKKEGGENTIDRNLALKEEGAMRICADPDFLPSCSVSQIGNLLRQA